MSRVALSIAIAALVACIAMGTLTAWKVYEAAELEDEIDLLKESKSSLETAIAKAKFSEHVLTNRIKQSEALNISAAEDIHKILQAQGECLDANIDPDIAVILSRRGLRPTDRGPDPESGSAPDASGANADFGSGSDNLQRPSGSGDRAPE